MALLGNFATEAVIVFFVLSGAVISMRPYRGLRAYLRARAIRILPTYYLALALSLAVMLALGRQLSVRTLTGNMLFLQTLGGYITRPFETNLPTWSLCNEASYYVIFPLIGWRPRLLPTLLSIGLVSGIVRSMAPGLQGVPGHLVFTFAFLTYWLAGVFVIRFWQRGCHFSLEAGAYGFVLGLCLSRVHFTNEYYDFTRLLCVAIGAAFLCSSLVGAERPSKVAARRPAIAIPIAVRFFCSIIAAVSLLFASNSLVGTKATLLSTLLFSTVKPDWVVSRARVLVRPLAHALIYVGGLSYALYLVHYPVLMLFSSVWLGWPPLLKASVAAITSFGLAHLLDYSVQLWIRASSTVQNLSVGKHIRVRDLPVHDLAQQNVMPIVSDLSK